MPTESSSINSSDYTSDNKDDNLVILIDALDDMDESNASSELNQISMIDSKGRRIYY